MTVYEVRAVDAADAAALSALARRAKAHWGYPPEWIDAWTAELTLTPDYLRTHDGFVAISAGAPVGVCMIEVNGAEAELAHVWIAPDHHGRGVGRQLVDRALALARTRSVERVRVLSDPFAEPFYLRLGATRTGAEPAPMPGSPGRVLPVVEFTLP